VQPPPRHSVHCCTYGNHTIVDSCVLTVCQCNDLVQHHIQEATARCQACFPSQTSGQRPDRSNMLMAPPHRTQNHGLPVHCVCSTKEWVLGVHVRGARHPPVMSSNLASSQLPQLHLAILHLGVHRPSSTRASQASATTSSSSSSRTTMCCRILQP